jgi:hypothetical protein
MGDILLLARLGWEGLLTSEHYIDAEVPQGGHMWAHKAFIRAENVVSFDTHEGDVLNPWDRDSGNESIPVSCAFGVHVLNMFKWRSQGSGHQLQMQGEKFDLQSYIHQLLTEG